MTRGCYKADPIRSLPKSMHDIRFIRDNPDEFDHALEAARA